MASQSSPACDADFAAKPCLKRRINAAPANVHVPWTDPGKLVGWSGVPVKLEEGALQKATDLRFGLRYRISLTAIDDEQFQLGGVYREIVPNERLVFSWAWHSLTGPERCRAGANPWVS